MPNTPANPIPSEHFHDGALISCKLTDWTFTRYHTPGKSEYAVVYGTVVQDGSGRFAAGGRIRTSPVTRWAAPLAHTHNSVYCLPEGAGCFCDLPATLQPAIDSLGIVTHEVFEEGIRARGVVRRVRHRQDGLVRTLRKSFDLAERRIFQLLGQQLGEVLAPCLCAGECLAKAFDRAGRASRLAVQ